MHLSPEYRAILRAREDEVMAAGIRQWWVCKQCGRDFTARRRESFCGSRCRKRYRDATAEAALSVALREAPRES
jgi:transposase-like protein